ncbi:acyl-CoA dehydrogenase family protein [Actinophytocola xinjiangensis]|uniref:acyl-CoA dehydrogenase family protein n=1 Tax=Actinophytocola xinjiangensis TaxID=485602 RepID=UPI000A68DF16|nr:acyl-CoA dehydrogenase family protein [Actinophytocola xinjiangensis]
MTPTTLAEEDLDRFRESVRAAMTSLSPPDRVREAVARGGRSEEDTWRVLTGQLDLAGLLLSEDAGGSGLGPAELAVALEETGAALLVGPLFATAALAVPLLVALGDSEVLGRHGPAIAAGRRTATVALAEHGGEWQPDAVRVSAHREGDRWLLDGVKDHVVDGADADLVLVVARAGDRLAVFEVDAATPGVERERLVPLDLTRPLARLTFAAAPATPLGPPDAGDAVEAATSVSRALLAAEQVGGARRCLDLAVDYARTRVQFGRPIGSFQAIKQKLADALIQVETAHSAVYAAVRSSGPDLAVRSRIAAFMAAEAYSAISAYTIQVHGGIGFTWEHDAHLYFKRAWSGAHLLGRTGDHLAAIGRHLDETIV